MIKIEHIAIWTADIEQMRHFYQQYFQLSSGEKYTNAKRGFTSYFLSTGNGARIELMHKDGIPAPTCRGEWQGLAHIAFSTGSRETVNELTERLRRDGYTVLSEPRTTGDGYYESVVTDPEGNLIEITE